jgi:hypothetical protein
MITNEIGYRNTLRHIEEMKASLATFTKRYPQLTGRKLKLLKQSDEAMIKDLENQVREYERTRLRKAS